ncbi:MAG: MFS transporter [Deltaproteobacteria bacterium]|nr:MFS transporter [Deltaproteobacteria bacterium]
MNDTINRKAILVTILMTSFISSSNMSMINVALPVIGKDLSMDAVLLGWVVTAHILSTAAFQVPIGKFADIFGRRKIYLAGIIIFTATTFLSGLSISGTMLIIARALAGIGAAMIITTGLAILTSVFPHQERGQAIAANIASVYLGISLGPLLGGVLTGHLGWRSIFHVSSVVGIAAVIMALLKLKGEWAEAGEESFDYHGSIVFALGISAAMYGLPEAYSMRGLIFLAAGVLGLIYFVRLEGMVKNPILDIRSFRSNPVFMLSNLAVLINYCGAYASTFLMSLYLQYILGYPPQTAGIILVAQPALMTFFALISSRLAEAFSPRYVATSGLVFNCAGLLMLSFLGKDSTLWYAVVSLGVFGIGGGLFSSPNADMTMSSVDKRLFGVASGTMATMRSMGMILSMGITMILFSIFMGKVEITPDYYPGFLSCMKTAYIIFACLCFGGIFIQMAAVRERHDKMDG